MRDALKGTPVAGEKVVVMGGDNYRIGMGGGAVSSVETGQYDNAIELNAVQRANPEMQNEYPTSFGRCPKPRKIPSSRFTTTEPEAI